jgi:hypothetical protein
MTWKEKLRHDPDLAELIIETFKTDLNKADARVKRLEFALKRIKSRVWEFTEETPTPEAWMRQTAQEALK